MTPDQVFQQLSNNNPMSISIRNTTAVHSVVVYGIIVENNLSTLSLDDPNYGKGSLIVNAAPNAKTNNIVHSKYDTWNVSFYLT